MSIKTIARALAAALLAGGLCSRAYAVGCVTSSATVAGINSIQGAVNSAPASLTGDHCVTVGNGTYNEQVVIEGIATNGFRIIISSASGATVTISPPSFSQAAFVVKNASVTIEGMAVVPTSTMTYGVVSSSPSVELRGVTVADAPGKIQFAGLFLAGQNKVSLSSVTVSSSSAYGLYLNGASYVTVADSYLESAKSYAAYMYGSSYNTIFQSTVTGGGLSGSLPAFYLSGPSVFNTISKSRVSSLNNHALWIGYGPSNNTISQSTLISNAANYRALELTNVTSNTVTQSFMTNPAGYGLLVTSSSQTTISQSTMTGGQFGLNIDASSGIVVTGSYAQGPSAAYVRSSTGTFLNNNDFFATGGGSALRVDNGNVGLSVSSTLLRGASGTGIELDAGSGGLLQFSSLTVSGVLHGFDIWGQAPGAVLAISSVVFQNLASGGTGIHFMGGNFLSTFTAVNFADSSISVNVNAAALSAGSRITMKDPLGPRGGSTFENDPGNYVDWPAFGITPLAYAGVSAGGLTANWSTSFAAGTVYYLRLSTDSFATVNSSQSTTNTSFVYTGLQASTSYRVRVSTVSSGQPFTDLGLVTTPAGGGGAVNFNFSGVLNGGGGAVIASANGQNEIGQGVVIDKVSSGGPYVYVLFESTTGPAGSPTSSHSLAKYGNAGTLISSRALAAPDTRGAAMALDNAGNLYVGEKDNAAGGARINKYDPSLNLMLSMPVPAANVGNVSGIVSDGTALYTINDSGSDNSAKLIKYGFGLVASATAAYSIGGVPVRAYALAMDVPGNLYVLVSSMTAGAPVRLLKYPPAFNAAGPDADVPVPGLAAPLLPDLAYASGKVLVGFADASGSSYFVKQFDASLSFTGVVSTVTNTVALPGQPNVALRSGPDGSVLMAGTANNNAGDYFVMKYDPASLALVSSAAFNSPTYLQDRAVGLAVLSATEAYVTGASSNTIADVNAVTVKLFLGAASGGSGSIFPSSYTGVSPDGLTANWSATFPPGTLYYLQISSNGFATVYSNNTTTGTSFSYSGLSSSLTYEVRVSTVVSGVPFTSLGPIATLGTGTSISGTVSYAGFQPGPIRVEAFTTPAYTGVPSASQILSNAPSQSYYLPVAAGTYYLRAYVDVFNNAAPPPWADQGTRGPISVAGSSVTGQNFSLSVDTLAPERPVGLTASPSAGQVMLTWAAPTTSTNGAVLQDLRGYVVQRSSGTLFDNIGGSPSLPMSSASLTFVDFAPIPNVVNYYRVLAVDFGRNQSPPSPQVSVSASAAASGGSITGRLSTFTVTTSGSFRVRIFQTPNGSFLAESNLASYSFSGLSSGTYYLKGFRDLDEDGIQDNLEPAGTFGGLGNNPYPIYIFGTSNIVADATLCDRSLLQLGSPVNAVLSASGCPARDAGPDRTTNLLAFEAGTGAAGSVSTGTPLIISMSRINSGGAFYDSQLIVFGPGGQIVASNSSPGGAAVNLTPLETGVYVVEPTSFYGFSYGSYTVTMSAGSTGSDPGGINGTLSYSGSQGGNLFLRFFGNSTFSGLPIATMSVTAAAGAISPPLAFNRQFLPLGTYWIDAFRDTSGSGTFNPTYQAYGVCNGGASVTLTAGTPTAGVGNCTLFDPGAAATGSGSISGSLSYFGAFSGTLRARLFALGSNAPAGFFDAALTPSTPVSYSFSGVSSGTYVIKAFLDSNNNFIPDAGEPVLTSPSAGLALLTGSNLTGQNFTLCDRRPILFGIPVADFWTASDCPAPERPGAFMRMYTFSGARGQPVTLEARASGFYGSFLALYDPDGNLVADDDGSSNAAGNAEISAFELPLDGLYTVAASPYSANVTGQMELSLSGSGGELGSISGSVVYSGNQGGQKLVGLFNSPNFSSSTQVDGVSVSSDSSFSFYGLVTGTSYYLGAFVDVNLNFIPDLEEDKGLFGAGAQADPVVLNSGQNLTGVSILISPSTTTAANASYVSGSIGYSGGKNIGGGGQLRVEFWSNSLFQGQPVALRSLPNGTTPYAYDISVPGGQSYFLRAFLDLNSNFLIDLNEPKGVYAPYNQGAESLYVPFFSNLSGIDFSMSDPGFSAGGGSVSGEGTAAVAPTSVAAGSVFSATITYTAGPGGIQSGGRIGFFLPPGFSYPQLVEAAVISGGASLSPVTFSGFSAFVTVNSGSFSSGQKMKFILNGLYAPCFLSAQQFTVVSAKDAASPPQPLFSVAESTLTMTVGAGPASFISPANPYFSLTQGQLSEAQRLEARDNCGNKAAVVSPVTAALRAKSYNFQSGQFDLDNSVGLTLSPALATAAATAVSFAVGQSSRNFYAVSASTGFKNIEIFYDLNGETTFYSGFTVLPGNALTNASVSTSPFTLGKTSATISQNALGFVNPVFINFTLGDPNLSWHILISSIPFRQDAVNMPVWETWGYGQPTAGQVTWDGRYSPWISNGARAPNGLYYVRIELGGSGVKNDSLLIRVNVPQLKGRFFDAGVLPNPPLSGVRIQVYGPSGSVYTETDAGGNYALPGLGAGLNKMLVSRDDFLGGDFSLTLTAGGAISTFTANSSDVSASLNSFGGLDVKMGRAPALLVTPSLGAGYSTQPFDQWGSLQVRGSTSAAAAQSFYGPLRLPAGTTTFDDGGQWDQASQQFVTRRLLKFKVAVGTYTVEAFFGGFAPSSASVFVPASGASISLPPFAKKASVSGQVSVPSNPAGLFVSVSAVPLSTVASAAGGFGGVYLPPGSLAAPYTVLGLEPGSYILRANAHGFSAVSLGPITVGTTDVTGSNFPVLGAGAQLSGTATIGLNTPAGRLLTLSVNAWSPGSMNFGSTQTFAMGTGAPLSMPYLIKGLDAGATYQIYTHIQGLDEAPDTLEAQPMSAAAPGVKNFSFIASSGVVSGSIQLPSGSTDFANVLLFGRTVESPRPEDIGREFVQVSTSLPNFRCLPSGSAAAGGYCPAGESSASFLVTGLKTETLDMTLFYKTTGETKKLRLSIVNGSTTSVSVNLAAQTYGISGSVNNQVTNALFNTNSKIVSNAPFSAPAGYPAGISSTTARLLAIKQDITQFRAAISEVFDPATTRVGFLTTAGTYSIDNVPSGVYFVRTENLRACATCPILVPSIGKIVRVSDAGVSSVTFTLSDGYSVGGQVSLDGGLQDSRVLELVVRNRRQEVVRSTSVYLGDADLGVTANAVAYSFANLPANDFYTLSVRDASLPAKYAGKPVKFPDPGLSPGGLQSNLSGQNILLQRAAFLIGRLKDASTGELIGAANAGLLAPNFQISATANPWVEGGFSVAVASMAGRPIQGDGYFRVGPLIPNVAYDLRLAQTSWDPAYLARGSQNYSPVQIGGLTPVSGESKDVGVVSLNQGQQLTGTLRQGTTSGLLLGNIKVLARPSSGDSGVLVQTYTNPQGRYTLWVSTFLSNQFDVTAAPREGNLASNGSVYGEVTLRNVNLLATTTADFLLNPLLAFVTGQVVVADAASGGELSFPFGENKGFPAAAINLQPKGVVPLKNPLGDIEAVTEAGGKFSIAALSTGTYSLRATSLGYSVFNATVTASTSTFRIFTGADTPSNILPGSVITLTRSATLSGRILKSDGSAPNDSDVGGVAAANFAAGEFVVGSVDVDPVAKTINSYAISGFKPGVAYDVVILPKEKSDDIVFPPEGDDVSFSALESTATKSLNLTFSPAGIDCQATSRALGNGQFQIKIDCTKALRNAQTSDSDLDSILTVSTVTSAGVSFVAPNGTGQLLGSDKVLSGNRRRITAIYRTATGETAFSLRLRAFSSTVDPATGVNFSIDKVFDFFSGVDSTIVGRVANINGGSVEMQPSAEDELLGLDERSNVSLNAGTFALESDPTVAATTISVAVGMRKGKDRQTLSALRLAKLGYAPALAPGVGEAASFPSEMAAAMQRYRTLASTTQINGANPLSSFYDIFLPAGIRHQLKQSADLTLSYDLAASSSTSTDGINVWFYDATLGRFVPETTNRRLDPINKTITVSVDHFSVFVVLDSTPVASRQNATPVNEIIAVNFPNPFDCITHSNIPVNNVLFGGGTHAPFQGTMIRFSLPGETTRVEDVKINVYNLAGELVRTLNPGGVAGGFTHYVPWNCANNSGQTVASGVYIGEVIWGGRRKLFKMAVIKGSGL